MHQPTVSVIIPTFNGEAHLAETLESALAQTHPPAEVIVVDDGSTDGTARIAASFPGVRYLYQPNAGANAARNTAILASRGDFLAFLDHDDLWMPDKLARQLAAFAADPTLDFVFGQIAHFYSPELTEAQRAGLGVAAEIAPGITVSALLARRTSFLRVGLFDVSQRLAELAAWYALALDMQMKMTVLPEIVTRRRIHLHNTTLRAGSQSKQAFVPVLRAILERRRSVPTDEQPGSD